MHLFWLFWQSSIDDHNMFIKEVAKLLPFLRISKILILFVAHYLGDLMYSKGSGMSYRRLNSLDCTFQYLSWSCSGTTIFTRSLHKLWYHRVVSYRRVSLCRMLWRSFYLMSLWGGQYRYWNLAESVNLWQLKVVAFWWLRKRDVYT